MRHQSMTVGLVVVAMAIGRLFEVGSRESRIGSVGKVFLCTEEVERCDVSIHVRGGTGAHSGIGNERWRPSYVPFMRNK